MTTVLYVAAYAMLSTGGVLLLRSALDDLGPLSAGSVRGVIGEPRFLLGFALYALSFLAWLLALRRFEVTRIFPVFVGAGYCCVVLGAYAFLGEAVSLSRVLGIAVILAGILLVLR